VTSPERFGSYLVYEQIGKGGMATVHRAELITPRGAKEEVALKRLVPTTKRELVKIFVDEGRLLRYLQHPNIAGARDAGRLFGTYYIAMEYVRGRTLKELVEHCRRGVGVVPQAVTLNLAAQLCDALDHAHNRTDEHGNPLVIIHRDVTPANLLISESGLLKLIDFGLAKAKGTRSEDSGVGVIKGKYGYIAPEYLAGTLDHRADLWAVGIIMYELLTSRRLFEGADAYETMMRVRELPIPRPSLANPQITPELDQLVMTALERDLDRRWQSAAAMRDGIRKVMEQPDNAMDNRGVAEWIKWAFEQKPGRTPQLTPIVPMPAQAPPPDTPEAMALDPAEAVRLPQFAQIPWTLPNIVWAACAGAIVLLLLGAIVWKLVG
jgi:eukaryotic-like serine/threonine-protein kinase